NTQSLRPLWQLRPQELSLQTNPATHTRPPAPAQPPQLSRSLVVSTHLPEPAGHSVVPGVPITLQCPETQCVPERQALLPAPLEAVVQAPQLASSVFRSRQLPEQLVRPGMHSVVHCPGAPVVGGLHTLPCAQTLPQVPQLLRSLERF